MSKPSETLDPSLTERLRQELERGWAQAEAALQIMVQPVSAPVGTTPKDLVWTKNKAKLYRYHQPERRHATPILLIYALINRPYILDLMPGNSLVEYLVSEGYDVFMLDWGVPAEEDAGLRLDDYVLDYMPRAVKQVLRHSGAKELSMFGYCIGGTLSAMYAACHPDAPLRNLVLLTTPIDFSDAGLYSAWLDPRYFNADRVAETCKLVPTEMLDWGAKMLKPMPNYIGTYAALLDRIEDREYVKGWMAMNRWVNDGIPFAGAAYRQWISEFYQQNKLIKGELKLGGRPVLLSNIRCSVLNAYAELDHIALPCQSKPLLSVISSSDATELPIRAGHVGIVAGRSASRNFFPKLNDWLSKRSN
ncbi:Poly-beta-hydroxybutyrate polymerase [compost metagenome]